MSKRVVRIAPALIATLLASLVAAAPALRAEPTAAAGDDCLARPSGPSPRGQHWYYRIDRASDNRKCWYLRDIEAKTGDAARTRAAPTAQPAVTAPIAQPAMAAPVEPPAEASPNPPALTDADAGLVPPTASPPAAIAPWPSAPTAEPVRESPADQSVSGPKLDGRDRDVRTPKRVRLVPAERPVPAEQSVIEQSDHVPALLGAAFALVLILVGSAVAHVIFNYLRRPRREFAHDLPIMVDAALPRMSESPSIALRRPDIRRVAVAPGEHPGQAQWRDSPMRAESRPEDDRMPAAQPETAVVIEHTVRNLLQRLRAELQFRPPTDAGARRPLDRDRKP